MKFTETSLSGVYVIEPKVFKDSRGFFMESYNKKVFKTHGIIVEFVQDNISRSTKGTLRGLHYQLAPHAQGKLVRVSEGEVFDCVVDIRLGSPTFGKWLGFTLNSRDRKALYVPPGFAHGFCVLSAEAEFTYKCTALYHPESERTIAWNDAAIGIAWPLQPDADLISEKDKKGVLLDKAELNTHFEETGCCR